jgi:GNAT superfamily N-acetyltransferase
MSIEMTYELRSPSNSQDWDAYHAIRRHVLFERRGRIGAYDANHPDEQKPGNFPKVLALGQEVLGVIRIDLAPPEALFRRVAVREDQQRRGLGTILLRLAEQFALEHGCGNLASHVDRAAVPFYAKCGFSVADSGEPAASTILMSKIVIA